MKHPDLSVVLITYNHERFIAEAIESVLAQTYKDYEFIIVNDGSTDRTQEIIDGFTDDRITAIHQKNQGPSVAGNNGIIRAKGKYIAYISGDDVCYPNRLERQLEYCERLNGHIIFSMCDFIGDDSNIFQPPDHIKNVFRFDNKPREGILNYLFNRGNYIVAPSLFGERKAFLDAGLFNPLYLQLQDYDLWIKLLLKNYEFYIVQEKLIKYRVRNDNLNISSDTPIARKRLYFEYTHVLRNFIELNSVEDFLKVFPDAERYGSVKKEFIPYFISRLAIDNENKNPIHQNFGINQLFELLNNEEYAMKVEKEYGFSYTDFFKLSGCSDLFDIDAVRLKRRLESENARLEAERIRIQQELNRIYSSRNWRLLTRIIRIKDRVFPQQSKKKILNILSRFIKSFYSVNRLGKVIMTEGRDGFIHELRLINYKKGGSADPIFNSWIIKNEPDKSQLMAMRLEVNSLPYQPKVSIVTPVYNPNEYDLTECLKSVLLQTYPNWELCIADGGSDKPYVKEVIKRFAKKDHRIKYVFLADNKGIAGNSNEALKLATGEYVAFLDHDDMLAPFALYEVVKLLNRDSTIDFIYSDEDKVHALADNSSRYFPHFKPDWSPDSMLSYNYVCHFAVARKRIIDDIGGFREGFNGAQDYDLLLRVIEKTDNIFHIPKILYHWRAASESTASRPETKLYAFTAGKKAIKEYLNKKGLEADVLDGLFVGSLRVKYTVRPSQKVSIIIPTKDKVHLLKKCISSILEKTDYKDYEILIIDNQSKEQETYNYYNSIKTEPRIRIFQYDKPFNYSAINNYGVKSTDAEFLLFLNNDIEVISPEWMSAMLEFAQRDDVGAVGAKLYYPNDTIQHAGVIIGLYGMADHSYRHFPRSSHGDLGRISIIQNLSAVTAGCMMMRRKVFEEVGGFEEKLTVAFNDVDLCLKIREKGYLIVYTPYAELYHYESASRGKEDTPEKLARANQEYDFMKTKWKHILEAGDPYYNPNLTLKNTDFSIKV